MSLRSFILFIFIYLLGYLPDSKIARTPTSVSLSKDNCIENVLDLINARPAVKNVKLHYPKGFEGKKNNHIQYGFEVEYTMDEAKVIFDNYMPHKSIYKDGKKNWLNLSFQDQLKFFDNNLTKIFPNGTRTPGKMIKIKKTIESDYLTDSLIYDSGNFELVYNPMDSIEELFRTIERSKKILGTGSMQVMISQTYKKSMYKDQAAISVRIEEELGYFNYVNELDTLEKLMNGYERYKLNPNILAAQSFKHPWLGPMTLDKNIKLQSILNLRYTEGAKLKQALEDYDKLVTSNKFIGGLSFRPDIGLSQGRISAEIRDCHKNIDCIEARVKRETFFLMKGKRSFRKFSKMPSFDPKKTSEKSFTVLEEELLYSLFPAFNNLFDVDDMIVSRNFSYPLRDWNRHLSLLGREDLKNVVALAQKNYKKKISLILYDYNKRDLQKPIVAKRLIMGALVEFVYESKLYDAFKLKMDDEFTIKDLGQFDQFNITFNMNHRLYREELNPHVQVPYILLHQMSC